MKEQGAYQDFESDTYESFEQDNTALLQDYLTQYNWLDEEEQALKERKDELRNKIKEEMIKADLDDYRTENLGYVQFKEAKPQMRLNTKLVEDYCKKNKLDIMSFKAPTQTSGKTLKVVPAESAAKQKAFMQK